MAKVVNLKTDPYDVYIGRTGKGQNGYFGNPFEIGKDGTREEVIDKFKEYFLKRVEEDEVFKSQILKLKYKTLGCFCKQPDREIRCHGDIIVEWLDSQPKAE